MSIGEVIKFGNRRVFRFNAHKYPIECVRGFISKTRIPRFRIDYNVAEGEQLQLASWAPVGTGLVYVFKNDIYYISAPENVLNPERITDDGVEGVIYNGVPDWVYEGLCA